MTGQRERCPRCGETDKPAKLRECGPPHYAMACLHPWHAGATPAETEERKAAEVTSGERDNRMLKLFTEWRKAEGRRFNGEVSTLPAFDAGYSASTASHEQRVKELEEALEDTEAAWKVRCELQRTAERQLAEAREALKKIAKQMDKHGINGDRDLKVQRIAEAALRRIDGK